MTAEQSATWNAFRILETVLLRTRIRTAGATTAGTFTAAIHPELTAVQMRIQITGRMPLLHAAGQRLARKIISMFQSAMTVRHVRDSGRMHTAIITYAVEQFWMMTLDAPRLLEKPKSAVLI
jgi:hypothetical protein